jgi:2-C-methyl-D-erythritol 4-phosphate cytidylyltransferase
VVIHDGVRPIVSPTQISDCIVTAKGYDACILGIPAYDTLKKVSRNGAIEATVDRKTIWLAQTPQAFKADLIKKAHLEAHMGNILETDDAALVERLGVPIKIIAGSRKNIKITTSEDFELCEALISSYRGGY